MDLVKPGHRCPFHERGAIAMLYLITCLGIDAQKGQWFRANPEKIIRP
jgi:hypothetical protein